MKSYTLVLFAVIISSLISCQENDNNDHSNQNEVKLITLPPYANSILTNNNNFGVHLFKTITIQEQKNMLLSPFSVNISLSMLLNGTNGETFNQINKMLGYESLTQNEINDLYSLLTTQLLEADEKVTLTLANAIFYKNNFPVKETFKTQIQNTYQAEIKGLDFNDTTNTLNSINDWVSNNTNGKINKVLSNLSPNAVMFLLNAVYFKGNWTQKFDKGKTQNLNFTLNNGSNINTPTMKGEIPIKVLYGNNFKAYELSYGRNNFVMDLILPSKNLLEFLNEFNSDIYQEITAGLDQQTNKTNYTILLPKFKFKYEKYLNENLISLGMIDAFSQPNANLSNLSDIPTFVSFVKQNSYIEVNEEGTEAAAVTTTGIETTSSGDSKLVHFNKPFIFSIRERTTNTLLFIGAVYNPLEE